MPNSDAELPEGGLPAGSEAEFRHSDAVRAYWTTERQRQAIANTAADVDGAWRLRGERRRLRLLWDLAAPLLTPPAPTPRDRGPATGAERVVFHAVAYALLSDSSWQDLPPALGVAAADARQCFEEWTRAGLWQRLQERARQEPVDGVVGWTAAMAVAAAMRAGGGAGDQDGSVPGGAEGREE
ncbi:hypothetical protein BIV57_01105 [Mangrovactinospora gilvigrisea]|uniref:Insertion element IS402-like domain-containing protein n=1 Tax=Mangrovactinospora gilvigrisea TaxID=1428644 RepID=A0A1J7BLE0_9ACTN|nr:transposase [Mangrovactinospora gilvigrisea]OIV39462.1 hypothetical protein BIV57_01105 [Mangrovactinospora gilvigrisea]